MEWTKNSAPVINIRYTMTVVVIAPSSIPRDDIEREMRGKVHEFAIGSSRLFPIEVAINRHSNPNDQRRID